MTCTAPDPTRLVREYGCQLCDRRGLPRWHSEFSPLFAAHINYQGKHSYHERKPTPAEVLRRVMDE